MKNPNGYGCLKHLSGSRRNPWAFVVTDGGKQKVKGYFPTKLEALAPKPCVGKAIGKV